MTVSISRTSTHLSNAQLDDVLQHLGDVPLDEATASDDAPDLDERPDMLLTATDCANATIGVFGMFGSFVAEAASAVASAPILNAQFFRAHQVGDELNLRYQSAVLRGELSALEGRNGSEVHERREREVDGFRDGVQRLEHASPADVAAAIDVVQNALADGFVTAAEGRDHGPAFERRCEREMVFRHGAEDARRLREQDPDEYAARLASSRARLASLPTEERATPEGTSSPRSTGGTQAPATDTMDAGLAQPIRG